MYYIIMDLEWNNAYSRRQKGFINEIIEIGAVMLDENLEIVDTYSVLLRSIIGKKLTTRVKELTHLSNEDLADGITYPRAVSQLKNWIGNKDVIVMTWGNSDIRTMLDNCKYFMGISKIPFLQKYLDLQRYCQEMLGVDLSNQIGLSAAAEKFGIDVSQFNTHRALEDSLLSYRCLKKCFDKKIIDEKTSVCNDEFYARLTFKAHTITNINNPKIDKSLMKCSCMECGKNMQRISEWKNVNQSFRATFYCKKCDVLMSCNIRFKEYYDRIDMKLTYKRIEKNVQNENSETPEDN